MCVLDHWISVEGFVFCLFFFFKQKTAYEMRISDWSSDVCSSDLLSFSNAEQVAAQYSAFDDFKITGTGSDEYGVYVAFRFPAVMQIGRASCRERVCQYV